jgi:hypothetical protein
MAVLSSAPPVISAIEKVKILNSSKNEKLTPHIE